MRTSLENLRTDEIIYEPDPHKAVALLRAGYIVRSPSARTRIEQAAEKKKTSQLQAYHPDHEGYIYVFAASIHVKIGISWLNVERRWASIRSSNPLLERPLYVSPALGKKVMLLERAAHKQLIQFHVSGEWFSCERSHAISVVENLVKGASI